MARMRACAGVRDRPAHAGRGDPGLGLPLAARPVVDGFRGESRAPLRAPVRGPDLPPGATPSWRAIVSRNPRRGEKPMSDHTRFQLDQSRLPKAWYNINADMPVPPTPVLHPGTMQPVTPDFLSVLFPMNIVMQEVCQDRWVEIPEPVREIYRMWRPTPMHLAVRLEKALGTPAHIYYKNETVSPVGSHKPNTAVAQAFY